MSTAVLRFPQLSSGDPGQPTLGSWMLGLTPPTQEIEPALAVAGQFPICACL